jgi:hypothetical protein
MMRNGRARKENDCGNQIRKGIGEQSVIIVRKLPQNVSMWPMIPTESNTTETQCSSTNSNVHELSKQSVNNHSRTRSHSWGQWDFEGEFCTFLPREIPQRQDDTGCMYLNVEKR